MLNRTLLTGLILVTTLLSSSSAEAQNVRDRRVRDIQAFLQQQRDALEEARGIQLLAEFQAILVDGLIADAWQDFDDLGDPADLDPFKRATAEAKLGDAEIFILIAEDREFWGGLRLDAAEIVFDMAEQEIANGNLDEAEDLITAGGSAVITGRQNFVEARITYGVAQDRIRCATDVIECLRDDLERIEIDHVVQTTQAQVSA